MKTLTLYHGSTDIIEAPVFGKGKTYNDYGQGFYCTENMELAREWACLEGIDGYVNRYTINLDHLSVLNLRDPKYSILHWLTILTENRKLRISTPAMRRGVEWLQNHFHIDTAAYDAIIGYRADDSYFDYAESFLNNAISVEQLAAAMKLGKLGEQIVLKSQFAFSRIRFEGFDVAEKEEFYVPRKARDDEANRLYLELLEEESDGLYIQDIIRGGITNDDSRIPRNISE